MIRGLGVEFRHVEIDAAALDALELEFDYIFIGIGLGAMDRLNITGENGPNVIDALSFIAAYKTDPPFEIPARVAVIGGGNTAIDAANAAHRLGALEVHLFYRRTAAEMPAFAFEFEHSKLEGVNFHWNCKPVEILPTGIRFEHFEFACDLIIPALGQSRANAVRSRIDNKKYFGGGDCVNGGREVVDAVADGKRAALAIVAQSSGAAGPDPSREAHYA
jgi:glutamate synthase (NADPH/NADH) small chain